jgi:tubulin polyglutamylase TTLL6/13
MYRDGLARFATVAYKTPAQSNMNNLFMHLTNYAINKDNPSYQQNVDEADDNVGHKRSYAAVIKQLRGIHGDEAIDTMVQQMHDIIIKTMCIA